MQNEAVAERELYRGESALVLVEGAAVEQQGAGEAWLHDDTVISREVEHDQLGSPPRTDNGYAPCPAGELVRIDLAQDIGTVHRDSFDRAASDLPVEITSHGFRLRKLGHDGE